MENKIKIFELFAGYGGASFALKKAGIPFECVGYSEVDKYAIQCYNQNHYGIKNYGDCTQINPNNIPDFDLLTGGFPCQSFSVAGKGLGYKDTRGTLFHEIIRIAEVKKPKYMLLENVKGLTFKNHRDTFNLILSELRRIGYYVKYKVLNTKEYGIPQNRERIFFFCFRDRKEWEDFKVPAKVPLKIFLKDILETEVDEKYYLNRPQVERLINNFRSYNERMCKKGNSPTLCARDYKDPKVVDIYEINKDNPERPSYIQIDKGHHSQQDRYYNPNNCSPTMVQNVPKIIDCYNKTIKEDVVPTLTEPHHNNLRLLEPFIAASRSYPRTGTKEIDGERKQQIEPRFDGCTNTISTIQKDNLVMNTITEAFGRGGSSKEYIKMVEKTSMANISKTHPCLNPNDLRKGFSGQNKQTMIKSRMIRKLTPTECFRLMGFLDDSINLEGLSNTQRYKLAGNGWDINLVSKLFRRMLK